MDKRIHITAEGLAALQAEYDDLVNVRRPAIIRAVAQAREEGDLRENGGYHAAKHDQGFIEGRIRDIEAMLKRVEVIDTSPTAADEIRLGSTVTIEIDGDEETYTIVGAVEAKPALGRISNVSPVGQALIGRRVGDQVQIQTPSSTMQARVLAIK